MVTAAAAAAAEGQRRYSNNNKKQYKKKHGNSNIEAAGRAWLLLSFLLLAASPPPPPGGGGAVIVFFLLVVVSAQTTDIQYYRDHAYQLVTDDKTWSDAKDYAASQTHCGGAPGYLATITSQDENDFIFENFHSGTEHSSEDGIFIWIGLNDRVEEGNTEGSFTWVQNNESLTYTNWHPGQPDNHLGVEHCTHLWAAQGRVGTWNDIDCTGYFPYTFHFVMEYDCPFDIFADSIDLNFAHDTNYANGEAIAIKYNYSGARPSEDVRVSFTYDILHGNDCKTEYALAGDISQSLYLSGFDYGDSVMEDGIVIAKIGIDLMTIEGSDNDAVWIHPDGDESLAILSFCGRFNIFVDGVKKNFHDSNVTVSIDLTSEDLNLLHGVNLDRDNAIVQDTNVNVSFPVSVSFCNDDADPVTPEAPQVFYAGAPIQICLELETPGGGAFFQGIHTMTYTARLMHQKFCSSTEQNLTRFSDWVYQGGSHNPPIDQYCDAQMTMKQWLESRRQKRARINPWLIPTTKQRQATTTSTRLLIFRDVRGVSG